MTYAIDWLAVELTVVTVAPFVAVVVAIAILTRPGGRR